MIRTYRPLSLSVGSSLHAIPALYYIRLQTYRSWSAVQFEEEAAGIAQHRSVLVTSPQRRRASCAVLADRLSYSGTEVSGQVTEQPARKYGQSQDLSIRFGDKGELRGPIRHRSYNKVRWGKRSAGEANQLTGDVLPPVAVAAGADVAYGMLGPALKNL